MLRVLRIDQAEPLPAMVRCAVLLIGKISVSPCTIPRRIPSKIPLSFFLSTLIEECPRGQFRPNHERSHPPGLPGGKMQSLEGRSEHGSW